MEKKRKMFIDVLTNDFARVSQQVSQQKDDIGQVTVCIEIGDLDLVGKTDNLLPVLAVVEGCIRQSEPRNKGLIIVDMRRATNFSVWYLAPLVRWIQRSKQTFETKLNFSQVVVQENSIWVNVFQKLFRMVNTSRPVHLTTEVNTPTKILKMLWFSAQPAIDSEP